MKYQAIKHWRDDSAFFLYPAIFLRTPLKATKDLLYQLGFVRTVGGGPSNTVCAESDIDHHKWTAIPTQISRTHIRRHVEVEPQFLITATTPGALEIFKYQAVSPEFICPLFKHFDDSCHLDVIYE
jgi:hypothetical protein